MIRGVLFWLHLATGLGADLVIVIMAAAAAPLAFQPQLIDGAERDLWSAPAPSAGAARLPLAGLLFDLDMAINQVSQAVPGVLSPTSCYHNVLRQWADA